MRQTSLPSVFNELASMVSNVQQKNSNEWSSTCPQCGGRDRFVILLSSHKGTPFAFCRQDSSHIWFPDMNKKMSEEDLRKMRELQIEVEQERIIKAEEAIAVLRDERAWERFYKQHNQWSMDLLKQRGFKSEMTIEYLQIGFVPDYEVWYMNNESWEKYYSPAHTIPIWTNDNKINDIKMRVLNPQDVNRDRFRSWGKTHISSLYVPGHDFPIADKVLIVEGEMKAGVVWEHLDTLNISVVGIQSKKPDPKVFSDIANCSTVYLGLDPDAFEKSDKSGVSAVEYCTEKLGKERVAIVEFPCKPDDGIASDSLDVMRYINMARKV